MAQDNLPPIVDFIPWKILAFIPYRLKNSSNYCPCGSGEHYRRCCRPQLPPFADQMLAMDRLFPHKGNRTYYLVAPREGDFSCIQHSPTS